MRAESFAELAYVALETDPSAMYRLEFYACDGPNAGERHAKATACTAQNEIRVQGQAESRTGRSPVYRRYQQCIQFQQLT